MVKSLLVKCSMSQFLQSCMLCQFQYASVSLPIFSLRFSMPQIFKLCWLFVKFSVPHFLQSCLLSVKFRIPRSFQSYSVLNTVCLISSSLACCLSNSLCLSFSSFACSVTFMCLTFSNLAFCQIECASFPPVILAVFKFNML
jgi:hypothetical protein